MNRKILFLFVIGTFSANIFCQTRFGGGLLISTPKMDTYSFGAGFGAKAKFYVAKSVALGALVSYEHFFNKNGWEDEWEAEWGWLYRDNNRNIAQLHPSVTVYLSDNKVKPYLSMEAGLTLEFISYDRKYNYSDPWVKFSDTETSFSFSPVLGIEIPTSEHLAFDLFVKYTGVDVDYFSLGLGLIFF